MKKNKDPRWKKSIFVHPHLPYNEIGGRGEAKKNRLKDVCPAAGW